MAYCWLCYEAGECVRRWSRASLEIWQGRSRVKKECAGRCRCWILFWRCISESVPLNLRKNQWSLGKKRKRKARLGNKSGKLTKKKTELAALEVCRIRSQKQWGVKRCWVLCLRTHLSLNLSKKSTFFPGTSHRAQIKDNIVKTQSEKKQNASEM